MKRFAGNGGAQLAYEETGEGRPVVLLHGYCGSGRYWDDVVPKLSDAGWRLIVPDLRGHGYSLAGEADGEDAYALERLAEDVAALLDELSLPAVYLFGHSLGGYIALAFAERYPDRLLGLGLIHSTSLPDTDAARQNRLKAADSIRADGVIPFVDDLTPKLFATDHRESMPDKLEKTLRIGYGTSPSAAAGCALGMMNRPDRGFVLERLDIPVLLLAGELDEVVPAGRRFPVTGERIERATLPGAGHMGMMESPDAFAATLLAFLRKRDAQIGAFDGAASS